MVVTCAATLHAHGVHVDSAADAAELATRCHSGTVPSNSATASPPTCARYGRRVSNQAAARSPESMTRRFLPGIWVLRRYQRGWLRGDLLAGVTVAAYLIPQVMAYAEVAGLPAITGLWAAVGPLVARQSTPLRRCARRWPNAASFSRSPGRSSTYARPWPQPVSSAGSGKAGDS